MKRVYCANGACRVSSDFNAEFSRFCYHCGVEMAPCPSCECGEEFSPTGSMRFCMQCGKALHTTGKRVQVFNAGLN